MSSKKRLVIMILSATLFVLAVEVLITVALAVLTSSQTIPSTGSILHK